MRKDSNLMEVMPQADAGRAGPLVHQRVIKEVAFRAGGNQREAVAQEKICFEAGLRAVGEAFGIFEPVASSPVPF